MRHMPGLDGLRGLAVVVVVLFHGGHLTGGYLGVDLFFVLSGYLITSLLLVEGTGSGKVGLARFWGRRARRLLPALGVLLVGVAAYAAFVADPWGNKIEFVSHRASVRAGRHPQVLARDRKPCRSSPVAIPCASHHSPAALRHTQKRERPRSERDEDERA